MDEFCNKNKWLPLKFTIKNFSNQGKHQEYGSIICNFKDIEMVKGERIYLKDKEGKKMKNWIKFEDHSIDKRLSLVEYLR
jgi:hypothetical protein